jgi:hypothetical protein
MAKGYTNLKIEPTGNTLVQALNLCSGPTGDGSFDPAEAENAGLQRITGSIQRVEITPGDGIVQPDNFFSVQLLNDTNIDLLANDATNLDNVEKTVISMELPPPVKNELVRVQGLDMGNDNDIFVKVYYQRGS